MSEDREKGPLVITIKGGPRSGRTTAAHLIATTLGRYGARVQVQDDDVSTQEMTDSRLTSVFEGRSVDIETVQTHHGHAVSWVPSPSGLSPLGLERVRLEETTQEIWAHSLENCNGAPCSIHHRTDHHMRDRPQVWRTDRGIMERVCKHGIGHPDPDDRAAQTDSVHGCDGCCTALRIPRWKGMR